METPVVVQKPRPVVGKKATKKPKIPTMEGTECNYVVLVFLVGIMYLIITTSD